MAAQYQRLEYLVQQYAEGHCTASELSELFGAIKDAAEDRELHEALEMLWSNTTGEGREAGIIAALNKEKIFQQVITTPQVYTLRKKIPWAQIAAAACIILLLTAAIYYWPGNSAGKPVVQQPAAQGSLPVTYTRHITLPDGSAVVLHAGSTINYSTGFGQQNRTLTLSGEAYFDIMHDTARPFIIRTGTLTTTVMGTAFTIKAYPGANEVTVSVTRGKVKVEDSRQVLAVLTRDQQVIYNTQQYIAKQQAINAGALVTDWAKQDMLFDELSFGAIAQVIGKRYGVTIEFNNAALKSCLIKASFSGTESLEKVLEVLTTIRGATYTKQNNTHYVIDGRGCE